MLFGDLLEARAFRNVTTMQKYSIHELSEILFLHMIILTLMAVDDNSRDKAASYAEKTMEYSQFDGIRFSATDLCNLFATVKHADRYLETKRVILPWLQIKRWLRSIERKNMGRTDTNSVLLKTQNQLKINNSIFNKWRRDAEDFANLTKIEKGVLLDQIYNKIRKTSYNSDLIIIFHGFIENEI
jgi:hypothetical protein